MKIRMLVGMMAILLLAGIKPVAAQEHVSDQDWRFTSSFNYFTGDYGVGGSTRTLYVPFILTRDLPRGDVQVTLPFISQESTGRVTVVRGKPVQTRRFGSGRTTNSGLGDLLLKGTYRYLEEHNADPLDLSFVGELKLPTADESKNLGTGGFDQTVGAEMNKLFEERWIAHLNLYYTFMGNADNQDLNNELALELGGTFKMEEFFWLSAFYRERSALVDGARNPRDIYLVTQYALENDVNIFGGILFGLSTGSPDTGFTLGLSKQF